MAGNITADMLVENFTRLATQRDHLVREVRTWTGNPNWPDPADSETTKPREEKEANG